VLQLEKRALTDNAAVLEQELTWLSALVDASIRLYFGQECRVRDVHEIVPPAVTDQPANYARVVADHEMTFDERAILALALVPHVRPQLLDPFLAKNPNIERGFTEFGGILTGNHGGFWPTVETAAFILGGDNLERRFAVQDLFDPDATLRRLRLVQLDDAQTAQSLFSAPLTLNKEYVGRFTTGHRHKPGYSSAFPAKRIGTPLEWSDLVLPDTILDEVEEIRAWIEHRHTLLRDWQLEKKIKPGFRSLFYGPPGTGKTLTASLLGKTTGLDVYRVDLSLVVSKWVGETEKNLAGVFDQAEASDWILFFDEADALFGKRTQTASANDRYANQEVAYLLQRVEDFPGVVILASNLKGNIDDAFARRFQSMIYFPVPGPDERLRLWSGAFSDRSRLEPAIDLVRVADEFEVTGGAIVNVLRSASLMALRRASQTVRLQDITEGIRRELRKDGKVV
jgi:ATPase family associated with various cellular activities (AAA)